jgi:asparagine synthase (glutamine-hydrolysing)
MRISLPCKYYEELLLKKLINVVNRTKCECIALSGGIDTSVILLACIIAGFKPKAITVAYREGIPKDLPYVIHISKLFNIDLDLIMLDYEEVLSIKDGVINCVGNELNSHKDGGCIEFRNDVVFYVALRRAKEINCNCVYVGSGSDELLLGYNFLLTLPSDEVDNTVKKFIHGRYPELKISKCLGVKTVAPFLEHDVVGLLLTIPLNCLRSERLLGKEVLRNILESYGLDIIAFRRKTPAEDGSGTKSICKSIYDY